MSARLDKWPNAAATPTVAPALAALRSPFALQLATAAAVLAAPIGGALFLYYHPEANPFYFDPAKHFYLVSGGALVSFLLGAFTVLGGLRLQDVRLFLTGLAFLGAAGFYSVHGLATPGFVLHGLYDTAALSEGFGLLWGAILLALAAFEPPGRLKRWIAAHQPQLLVAVLLLLFAYGLTAIFGHELFDAMVPDGNTFFVWGMATVALVFMAGAAFRTLQSYVAFRLPLQGALLAGIIILMQTQAMLALLPRWHLGWWLYHLFVLVGFLVVLYSIALEYMRGRSLMGALQQMALPDAVSQIKGGYHQSLLPLAAAAEARDNTTEGHLLRVAELSVRIGQALGLQRARLRSLAQGAFLHDIGKLNTPDSVLLKPGKLTPAEFALIKQHSASGYELLMRLKTFDREALVARHHHEWWDGSGYPDGLKGDEIPLEPRIVAVADVYDALTTDRPYRSALSHQDAVAIVLKEAGTHLDPACVEAFLRIVEDWHRLQLPEQPVAHPVASGNPR